MYNPFSLEGKIIFVTGASSGIGRGVAIECSRMGARVILSGRNEQRLMETLSLMEGENHLVIQGDLSQENNRQDVAAKIPALNGVVHCAGISQIQMAKYIDACSLQQIFNINVYTPILLNALFLKNKKIQRGSSIILMSSISGVFRSQVGEGCYGATKAALSGYVKSLALELSAQGIRVNCIHPGVVETPLLAVNNETLGEQGLITLKQKYPLKRFGQPDDIAYAVVYLLSDASNWVTGTKLLVDGGFCLS